MPQDDWVQKFQSMPKDRQKQLLDSMSKDQVMKLHAAIVGKKQQVKQATQAPVQEESTLTKVGRGAAIGVAEGLGIKPSASRKELITGTLQQAGQGISDLLRKTWEANQASGTFGPAARAAVTAVDIIPTLYMQTVHSLSEGSKEAVKAAQSGDWETAAEKGSEVATQAALLKGAKNAEVEPEAISRSATQKTIQKIVHDRALKVQDHIQAVHDAVKAEDAARWQGIEKTVDEAHPQGAIDLSKIGQETGKSVKETIKTPQKLAPTVSEVQKGTEPPKVFGSRLDPSNEAHAQLIQRLKDSGAIPDSEQASFGQVRQLRSKLGRELRGSSTLSGESRSVGWKLYGDLTNAMRNVAEESGMPGAFDDANKFHTQYMEDFVDKDALLGKSLEGKNAHEVMNHLSDPKYAEQARRIMDKYRGHGMNPEMIKNESKIFEKLGSGLPKQLDFSRWEMMGYAAGPAFGRPLAGPMYTASRELYNLIQRDRALRLVKSKNQALAAAAEKLGPKSSIKEIMTEASKVQQ